MPRKKSESETLPPDLTAVVDTSVIIDQIRSKSAGSEELIKEASDYYRRAKEFISGTGLPDSYNLSEKGRVSIVERLSKSITVISKVSFDVQDMLSAVRSRKEYLKIIRNEFANTIYRTDANIRNIKTVGEKEKYIEAVLSELDHIIIRLDELVHQYNSLRFIAGSVMKSWWTGLAFISWKRWEGGSFDADDVVDGVVKESEVSPEQLLSFSQALGTEKPSEGFEDKANITPMDITTPTYTTVTSKEMVITDMTPEPEPTVTTTPTTVTEEKSIFDSDDSDSSMDEFLEETEEEKKIKNTEFEIEEDAPSKAVPAFSAPDKEEEISFSFDEETPVKPTKASSSINSTPSASKSGSSSGDSDLDSVNIIF